MKILGVIPARYASTRFEGKPLKDINGYPMIEWVYKRAENAAVDKLVVATDDQRIYDAVKNFGGNVVMTSKEHENGTSRIIEVINNPEYSDFDFVINIQGDEPLIDIKSINLLANNYREEKSEIVTLKKAFRKDEDVSNPNTVKVITDFNCNAIYFSIYGYTSNFLNELKNLKEGVLEKIESLEQLRFIENGYKIKVLETDSEVIGVDTEEDLAEVIEYVKKKGITL